MEPDTIPDTLSIAQSAKEMHDKARRMVGITEQIAKLSRRIEEVSQTKETIRVSCFLRNESEWFNLDCHGQKRDLAREMILTHLKEQLAMLYGDYEALLSKMNE
jgi:hypothetical protein